MAYLKVRRKMQSIGIKATLYFLLKRLYDSLFHSSNLLFRANLPTYQLNDYSINKNVVLHEKATFRELTQTEKKELRDYGGDKLLELFENRLKRGHRLFLKYLSDEFAGAIWIYQGGGKNFYYIPLSENDCLVLAGFTFDKFRRQGILTTSLVKLLNQMKEEGFHLAFGSTKEWNFSQKAVLKAGFHYIGRFYEFRLLKRNILIWNDIIDRDFQ